MWKSVALYGGLLVAGTLALQWIDYQHLARAYSTDIYMALVAVGFLSLGVFLGAHVLAGPKPTAFDGNPKAQAALGISPRELAVLQELATGRSNKEIAARLHVSPNTVKTHIAHVFEKLEAKRRTEAINRARELGLLK